MSTSTRPQRDSARLSDYRAALTAPGALAPVLTSALGRLPVAMIGLATLLYLQRSYGSFAIAGLVSAGMLVGAAVGSVLQGRIADRLGPSRPLLVATLAFAAMTAALVTAVEVHAPVPLLMVASVAVGISLPGVSGASRALWSDLVPSGPQRLAAYSYEAISLEVFFILGPAIAALLVLTPWPGTGVVVGGSAMALGSAAFACTAAVRARRPAPRAAAPPARVLGALIEPGLRTVALASLGFGLVVGVVEVAVPALTTASGQPGLGGVLLSLWSVSSVLAGVIYLRAPWPRPLHLRIPALLAGFGLLVLAMATAGDGVVLLAILMLAAGTLITPQVTSHSIAVEQAAPAGNATEAFGWIITAATLGLAGGQATAGLLVEFGGPPVAFAAGGVAGLLLAALLWARRRTLLPKIVPTEPADQAPVVARQDR